MGKTIFLDDKEDYLRRKINRNIVVFFFKWISTIVVVLVLFGMFTRKLPILLIETNFITTIVFLVILALWGYAWHTDIHLFLKRRRQKRPLLTDPLTIEFIIILIFAFLIAWYFFPSIFQSLKIDNLGVNSVTNSGDKSSEQNVDSNNLKKMCVNKCADEGTGMDGFIYPMSESDKYIMCTCSNGNNYVTDLSHCSNNPSISSCGKISWNKVSG